MSNLNVMRKSVQLKPRFNCTNEVKGVRGDSIRIDEAHDIVCFKSGELEYYFDRDDIGPCHVNVEEETSVKTSGGSMLTRAVIGSLFGGVGAVVGAATADKVTVHKVRKVAVTMRIPMFTIPNDFTLFQSRYSTTTPHTAEQAIAEAEKLAAYLEKLRSARFSSSSAPQPRTSLPEQLQHLMELYERGMLSDEELAAAKTKLLT